MPVEARNAARTGGALDPTDHFTGPRLLFDLFADEPVHEDLGGIVFGGNCGLIDGVDALGVSLLHVLSVPRCFEQRTEILPGLRDAGQLRFRTSIHDVLNDLGGMGSLFGGLFGEEPGEPVQVVRAAPDGEGLVAMGR